MKSFNLLFRLMIALALAAAFPAFAQTLADTPAPQATEVEPTKPAQRTPEELRHSAAMPDAKRIQLCRKKRNKPLEEWKWSYPSAQIGEGLTPPTIIARAVPRFVRGRPGKVVIDALIDEDGCVRETKVIQSLGKAQDTAVLDAVRQWVFRPALFNGQATRVHYSVTVNCP